ncbi:MAG: heme exporter protein CcmD [Pseudomonadota bacterium]
MIPSFDHTGPFIWAAYAFSATLMGALIGYIVFRAGAVKDRLERLEREEGEE